MQDQPNAKSRQLDDQQWSLRHGSDQSEARRLNDLAELEVDMQNAGLCIRLRGDDESLADESQLRRAA